MFDFLNQIVEEFSKLLVAGLRKIEKENKLLYSAGVITSVLIMLAAIAIPLFIDEKVDFFGIKTTFSVLFTIFIGFILAVSLLVSYINPSNYQKKKEVSGYEEIYYQKLRDAYIEAVNKNQTNEINQVSDIDIDEIVKKRVDEYLESSFKDYVEEKYGESAIKANQIKQVEAQIKELQSGVNIQIDKLSRNGTVNLVIGLSTTITAIVLLINLISDIKVRTFPDTTSLIIYLAPRTTLAIFIEVFSFFFLKLYKSNLEDIKYFHNERTNIDSKVIGLKAAYSLDKEDTLIEVIKSFIIVERNFILKKDETTTEIEKSKLSNQQSSDLLARVSDIIDKAKK